MTDELKPCPFCGSKRTYIFERQNRVKCHDCDTEAPLTIWNRRAADPACSFCGNTPPIIPASLEALKAEVAALRAEIARKDEALRFYAGEWFANAEGDSSTPGLMRSWQEPTDALWTDAGRRAREALGEG